LFEARPFGAAEFSRDLDLAIIASLRNIAALRKSMVDLHAEVIAVPPFDLKYLRKGHAIHFSCHHPEVEGLRVDVMSRMRGVDSFERLWCRRTTIELPSGTTFDLLSLPDLVQAKKTERDKASSGSTDAVHAETLRARRTHLRYLRVTASRPRCRLRRGVSEASAKPGPGTG